MKALINLCVFVHNAILRCVVSLQVSVVVPSGSNLTGGDLWNGAAEDDAASSLALDASDGGLWSGNFVPPPPRPIFLDDSATPDGLTTCDLCSWAWQNDNAFTLDAAMG